MKNLFFNLLVMICVIGVAQNKYYNLKKGFVAEGYDVVSYFNGKPIKGNKKIIYEYDGVKFKFVNDTNLEKFKKSPEKFIPQYGGWCAYALGANQERYDINPKTYEIRNEKLYLFYNSFGINTLDKWKDENPEQLRDKADQFWNGQAKK